MKEITSELIDSTYDAIELMNIFTQRLSEGEIGGREASSMSWLLGRAKERLEPVIAALEEVETDRRRAAENEVDFDLFELGSEFLAIYEKFRRRRQGLGDTA